MHRLKRELMQSDFRYVDSRVSFAHRFYQLVHEKKPAVETEPLLLDPELSFEKSEVYPPYTAEPPDSITLIVPGLFGNSLRSIVAPLMCARERLTVNGYRLSVAWVSGRSGCDHNARELRQQVLSCADSSGKPVNLIAYSKGCADALHMLGNYKDTHQSVASLVSYGGVVHGTPLATTVPGWLNTFLRYLPLPGEPFGDGRAIADLSPHRRRQWLLDHPLPENIRLASIVASPQPERVSRILKASYQKLLAIDKQNDSQVVCNDAILPQSELLAVVNADHWAIALPIAERHKLLADLFVDKNQFPRELLIQATIDHLNAATPDLT